MYYYIDMEFIVKTTYTQILCGFYSNAISFTFLSASSFSSCFLLIFFLYFIFVERRNYRLRYTYMQNTYEIAQQKKQLCFLKAELSISYSFVIFMIFFWHSKADVHFFTHPMANIRINHVSQSKTVHITSHIMSEKNTEYKTKARINCVNLDVCVYRLFFTVWLHFSHIHSHMDRVERRILNTHAYTMYYIRFIAHEIYD